MDDNVAVYARGVEYFNNFGKIGQAQELIDVEVPTNTYLLAIKAYNRVSNTAIHLHVTCYLSKKKWKKRNKN